MDFEKFTNKAKEALQTSQQIVSEYSHSEITPAHLLLVLLTQEDGTVASVLDKMKVDRRSLREDVSSHLDRQPSVQGDGQDEIYLSRSLKSVLDRAENLAHQMDDEYVSTEHMFLSLLEGDSEASDLLNDYPITEDGVLETMDDVRGSQNVDDPAAEEHYEVLEKFGRDLTQEAEDGKLDPVIGREDEIRRLTQILSRRTKNNPILIGEPGVGKTAIVEGLARRIVEGDAPKSLGNKRIVELNVGSMVAGAKYRGEFEDRLKAFINEVKESDGEIVLFIDEVHTVVGAGGAEGAVDASNILKPPLARGELRAIGATTLDEFRENIEQDAALERRFQKLLIEEPSVEDSVSILRGLQERYEAHHGVRITDSALVAAARLSDRYIGDRFLPDKAIDLIDEAASALRIEMDSKPAEIDRIEREIMQLEMEKQALSKEEAKEAQDRLHDVEEELANLQEKNDELKAKWQNEKEILDRIGECQEKIEDARIRMEKAHSIRPVRSSTVKFRICRMNSRRPRPSWITYRTANECSRKRLRMMTWQKWCPAGPVYP